MRARASGGAGNEDAPGADIPSLADYNDALVREVDERLRRALASGLRSDGYHVIRTAAADVLSVVGAAGAKEAGDSVFGPAPFAACIGYVNANLVGRGSTTPSGSPSDETAPANGGNDEPT